MIILSCLVPMIFGFVIAILFFAIILLLVIGLDNIESFFQPFADALMEIKIMRIFKKVFLILVLMGAMWALGMNILLEIAGV